MIITDLIERNGGKKEKKQDVIKRCEFKKFQAVCKLFYKMWENTKEGEEEKRGQLMNNVNSQK